jgi:hypothetical protein
MFQKNEAQHLLPLFCMYPELEAKSQPKWMFWSDEDWIYLHMRLLERSLEDLVNPTVGKEIVRDISSWIWAQIWVGRIPRAFSFHACAEVCGLDPEELQVLLLDKMQDVENNNGAIDAVRHHIVSRLSAFTGED